LESSNLLERQRPGTIAALLLVYYVCDRTETEPKRASSVIIIVIVREIFFAYHGYAARASRLGRVLARFSRAVAASTRK